MSYACLSRLEVDVCQCIAQGRTDLETAFKLGLKVSSVITFKRRAFAKLHVSRRGEVMVLLAPKFNPDLTARAVSTNEDKTPSETPHIVKT